MLREASGIASDSEVSEGTYLLTCFLGWEVNLDLENSEDEQNLGLALDFGIEGGWLKEEGLGMVCSQFSPFTQSKVTHLGKRK